MVGVTVMTVEVVEVHSVVSGASGIRVVGSVRDGCGGYSSYRGGISKNLSRATG
jgi:hypothetical protein